MGKTYEQPHLVVFKREIESGCGLADSGVGPFYCPADSKVYIDLAFYKDLEKKLHAPGEFARAYVLAHEVGHHVQRLLGYTRAAEPLALPAAVARSRRPPFGLSFKPTIWPEFGPIMASRNTSFLSLAISNPRSMPPARLATTSCRRKPRATSAPIRLLTAPRNNAIAGLAKDSRRVASMAPNSSSSCPTTNCNSATDASSQRLQRQEPASYYSPALGVGSGLSVQPVRAAAWRRTCC